MQNPWVNLPETPPFIALCDRESIQSYNQNADDEHRIHTEFMPEPFIGNPNAPVFILYRNPAFHKEHITILHNQDYLRLSRANLRHEHRGYPFYHLDPSLRDSPGYNWYRGKFKALIRDVGEEIVAHSIFVVEYFPYFTESEPGHLLSIPSQAYSFSLVEKAMRRRAVIIQAVGKNLWQNTAAIPGLATYPHSYELNSSRMPAISERNCPDGYPEIIRALGG